jgi:hypothetical protein
MGQNKRYAGHFGRLLDERIGDWVMREEPMLLTAGTYCELGFEHGT